jgi:glycerol kinase
MPGMAEALTAVALDLGTTSIKAALLDHNGALCHITRFSAPAINQVQDCYESDALRYTETAEQVLAQCLAYAAVRPPLGLCSQRSSLVIWDKSSGQPVTPLISWQDGRGKRFHDASGNAGTLIPALTGLRLTPYYFAPKLSVLLHENPTWREKLEQQEWLAGTLDTFLIWRWTNGRHFRTDASMAARTLLMDVHQLRWSKDLCDLFGIPMRILPQITPSAGLNLPLRNGLTLQASVGDQSAALFAGVPDDKTTALVNLGTGGFVIRFLDDAVHPPEGYLHTLVYQDRFKSPSMASEGTLNSISAALSPYPFRECTIEDFASNRIFCLAEPSGLGAPYFSSHLGLYFSESTAHLSPRQIGALLLEGIAFRVSEILESFHRQAPLFQVYLSGGLSELACLQYSIAQCVPFPVYHLQQKETSLLGAAMLASDTRTRHSYAVKIDLGHLNNAVHQKYQHWKVWLNELAGIYRQSC